MQARAIIGGVDYCVGGWGEYEINKRYSRYKHGVEENLYQNRSYIHAHDAVASVANLEVMNRAMDHLSDALKDHEARVGGFEESAFLPAITSYDLKAIIAHDYDDIVHLNAQLNNLAEVLHISAVKLETAPPLINETVDTKDITTVRALEKSIIPYMEWLEKSHAVMAKQMDDIAAKLTKKNEVSGAAETNNKISTLTRGERIDIASKNPPIFPSVKEVKDYLSLQFGSFDLINGKIVQNSLDMGIYYLLSYIEREDRKSFLTPFNLQLITRRTSSRKYAWFLVETVEASYTIRADPVDGNVYKFDIKNFVIWLRDNLVGSPPHKIKIKKYVKKIQSLGIRIYYKQEESSDGYVRLNHSDVVTKDERIDIMNQYYNLKESDFKSFDWTGFDKKVTNLRCKEPIEYGGDVDLDIVNKKISISKIRSGVSWGVHAYCRSFTSFHTHPSVRYKGNTAEYPSLQDLTSCVYLTNLKKATWHFVCAPEGIYIILPSILLIEMYNLHENEVMKIIEKQYKLAGSFIGNTMEVINYYLLLIRNAGFNIYFREKPCFKLLDIPDMVPSWNITNTEELLKEYNILSNMSPKDIFNIKFDIVDKVVGNTIIDHPSWLTATIKNNKLVLNGSGHAMPDINNIQTDLLEPGPLFIIYYPNEGLYPTIIPENLIKLAKNNYNIWAWIIIMTVSKMRLIRYKNGIETYNAEG